MERITTTELHDRVVVAMIAAADNPDSYDTPPVHRIVDAAIGVVVEGLVATIQAQLRFSPIARTEEAVMRGDPDNGNYILRAKVLEALEAAREDND